MPEDLIDDLIALVAKHGYVRDLVQAVVDSGVVLLRAVDGSWELRATETDQ